MNDIEQQLKVLHDGIRIDAPLVADFFEEHTELAEYTKQINAYTAHPTHRERQEVLKKKVKELLLLTFSEEELAHANIPWSEDWKINIVDHHGILNHPILVSTNIISNMFQLPAEKPKGVVVLSDSGVPLNNFFHKRGMKFCGEQLNIFPSRDRHVMAYAGKKQQHFPLLEAAERSEKKWSEAECATLKKVDEQLNTWGNAPHVANYRQQVQRINFHLWKELFEESLREKMPDIFYISNEELGGQMLRHFLQDSTHLFTRILCEEKTREIVVRSFMNVTGCWDQDLKRGSVFFWGIDDEQRKIPLQLVGNTLTSAPGFPAFTLDLTPHAIIEALDFERIYPGMFLVYGIAHFHCGIRPLVGYGSMNYQTRMKEAWVRAMKEIDPMELPLIESINTRGFIGGPKVTFGWNAQNGFEDFFALDIVHRGGMTKEYLQHLAQTPLSAVLQPALIDIYESYVRPERRQNITITSNDLMNDHFEWVKNVWKVN
ncbi:MAG: hypothetical protein KIH62_002025 [Candidatus Kerfeldbacteria bacterium]|nr:hypothetical protein [Candidatus Kerfeldbacteria bacterium]